MQSELAAHIGMTGKFFCRICQVKGKDKNREKDGPYGRGEAGRIEEFMIVRASPSILPPVSNPLGSADSLGLERIPFQSLRRPCS